MLPEGGECIEGVREYLLGIFAAAMVCAIVTRVIGEKGTVGAVVKLVAGLFLAFTVIQPWVDIRLDAVLDLAQNQSAAGQEAALAGQLLSRETMGAVIKERTEAYILDKATEMNVVLKVEVTLSDEEIPCPESVRLTGNVSPYAKARLQDIMLNDLGIMKEQQIWT